MDRCRSSLRSLPALNATGKPQRRRQVSPRLLCFGTPRQLQATTVRLNRNLLQSDVDCDPPKKLLLAPKCAPCSPLTHVSGLFLVLVVLMS